MKVTILSAAVLVALASSVVRADEPPLIDHQAIPCTVAGKATSVCASISDDSGVGRARIFFRAEGEKYYNLTEMAFGGLNYCGTIPPAREGKAKAIEYYVQAIDDAGNPQRTPTYLMQVETELVCDSAPIERDPARARMVTVYATSRKQGGKISKKFERDHVSFIRVQH